MDNLKHYLALSSAEFEMLQSSLLVLDKSNELCNAIDELFIFQMVSTKKFGKKETLALQEMKQIERNGFKYFISNLSKALSCPHIKGRKIKLYCIDRKNPQAV